MHAMQAIHQLLPGLRAGDAISSHALAIQQFLRGWGVASELYSQFESEEPAMHGLCHPFGEYSSQPNQALIYHHGIGSVLADFAARLPDPVILYYHNITPPEYMQVVHPRLARGLAWGREQLSLFAKRPYALAGSEYNRRELIAAGFRQVEVLSYFVQFDVLDSSPATAAGQAVIQRYGDGRTNWLFVGRTVPNKCQIDLVRMFAYYVHCIDPTARLLLVGSSVDTPGYRGEVERMVSLLQVGNIELCGAVPQAALGAYYQVSTGYISMSEHEGFGVPLLEAMHMGVPVVAYAASAVPDTLGPAGVLFHRKRFEVVAELLGLVASNAGLRQRLVAVQRQRVAEFAPARIATQLRACLERAGLL